MNIFRILSTSLILLALSASSSSPSMLGEDQKSVLRATLPNGLRVAIVKNSLAPIVTVEANILVGASEDPAHFPGMAHAQEHMAFRGCADMTADQTASIYAQLGDENNANTQQEVTQFHTTVLAADLGIALEAQAKCLQDINDFEEDWKQERGSLIAEIDESLSDSNYEVFRRINLAMFAKTPYAYDGLGTKESFTRTTGKMLKSFYRQWYVPSNEILVIVGNIDPIETLKTITQMFGEIKNRYVPQPQSFSLGPFQSKKIILKSNSSYSVAYIAYRLPGTDSSDYAATVILADILANQRARLYQLVSTGIATQAEFGLEERYRKASVGIATVTVAPGSSLRYATGRLRRIFNDYARNGVSEDLVDAAKRSELSQRLFQSNSISGQAEAWSNAIAAEGRSSPDDDYEALRRVTQSDVNRVARESLLDASTISIRSLPMLSKVREFVRDYPNSTAEKSVLSEAVELPVWAAKRLEVLEIPQEYIEPSETVLDNGLRLIVRTDSTSPTVTLRGSVKHIAEVQTNVGKEGASEILESLYSYGTEKKDSDMFREELDDIAAEESAGYSFSLSVPRENFSRGVQLLAENEINPTFDTKAFVTAKKDTIQVVAADLRSPESRSIQAMDTALVPAGDPILRKASRETLLKLTLNDVRAYQKATVRPDLTTIVVVGDISLQDATAVIERWFGNWMAIGPRPRTILPPVPLNGASSVNVIDLSRRVDSVMLAEQLQVNRFDADYYPLQLGTQVLGGGFYATRLYRDLRRVKGYVYSVEVDLNAADTRATYSVSYDCSPTNLLKVRAIVERDLEQMRSSNISPSELHQAKASLLRQILLRESSEDELASDILDRAEMGLALDEPIKAAKKFIELDEEAVRTAFARDISIRNLVQVVRGPQLSSGDFRIQSTFRSISSRRHYSPTSRR
jgi:zinc protease